MQGGEDLGARFHRGGRGKGEDPSWGELGVLGGEPGVHRAAGREMSFTKRQEGPGQ